MLILRSPWSPLVFGAGFFLLGVSVWLFGGGHLLGRMLLTLSLPLIYEGGAWLGAAKVGRLYYDLDGNAIHSQAYEPRAAFVRCGLIYGLLFSILIAGEAGMFPRGLGRWVILTGTMLLWIAYVVLSHARQIATFARQEGLSTETGGRG